MKRFALPIIATLMSLSLSAADGDIPTPAATMMKMYNQHLANKGVFLDEGKEDIWDFTFEPELIEVLKPRAWGFDPLFFAQDAEIKDIKAKTISEKGGNALVLMEFTNFGEPVSLVASLRVTDHGWRLVNIVDPTNGADLLSDLHTPEFEGTEEEN
jgi:hypothetical protein